MGIDPLWIFMFKDGLVWFATVPYEWPTERNLDNLYMHLTNYAINKKNKDFVENRDDEKEGISHKWSLQ